MKRFIKLHLLVATLTVLPVCSVLAAEETAAEVNFNDDQITTFEAKVSQKQTQEANKFAATVNDLRPEAFLLVWRRCGSLRVLMVAYTEAS